MAHFAKIEWDDETRKKGIVKQVIVAEQDFINSGLVGDSHNWVQTSYNMRRGVHKLGGFPLRKNFAGVGYTYDRERDAFIPPKLYDSWTLNEDKCTWQRPLACDIIPDFDEEKEYILSPDGETWMEAQRGELHYEELE